MQESTSRAVASLHAIKKRGVPHLSPNKSLLRSGGRWYLACKSLAGIDKVPMINLGEPPAAELSRYTTAASHRQ
jgi:hypothetical protein